MIEKRRVLINAVSSVIQVVAIGVTLFILYRFLLNTIGIEQLGIWSVVLATTSVAAIANLGLSASVVKFVAKYMARSQEQTVVDVIQTAVISIAIAVGLLLIAIYPFASWLLSLVVPSDALRDALSILPYGLIALWVTIIASVFQSGLDGCHRIDLRSMLLVASAIFHLVLCFVLVPVHGLMGLAYAQVAQAIVLLIATWFTLKQVITKLPLVPCRWNRKLFQEMLRYGLNFQIVSITQLLYEPTVRILLTKFGGLAMTGFYEMASRMVLQFRMVLVSANQVVVPTIADLQEKDPEVIQKVYEDSYNLLFYIAVPFFLVIITLTPIISQLWIGTYEGVFVSFSMLLALGWLLNTLTAPAYFANLGIGTLSWNTVGHVVIAVLNLGLGLLLGNIYGGIGVVLGWVISLAIGSSVVTLSYHYQYKISVSELLPKESRGIVLASFCALAVSLVLYYGLSYKLSSLAIATIITLVFLAIAVRPLWYHPMRKRLMGWVTNELLNRADNSIEKRF
jgi:O-antigen/teichoic acid export membrane protein